ncbi:hypothetical protein [Aeromicrobium sp. 179-A 4D2 NHS]|uniref:hypothetical protein n=1 Tax=Aeromicrobium sp. 179-A 4D2 NHS TaxID=3142375 RepID=UPI0039A18398
MDYRLSPGVEPLTEEQVAVVLHSLADHTALIQAIDYTPRPEGRSYSLYDEAATSVGQWLHDVADDLEDIARDVRP